MGLLPPFYCTSLLEKSADHIKMLFLGTLLPAALQRFLEPWCYCWYCGAEHYCDNVGWPALFPISIHCLGGWHDGRQCWAWFAGCGYGSKWNCLPVQCTLKLGRSGSSRPWPASLLSFSTSTWGTTRTVTHGINETEVSDEKKVEKKVLK